MSRRNPSPNIRPLGQLPTTVDITEERNMHGVSPTPAPKTATPAEVLEGAFQYGKQAVANGSSALMRKCSGAVNRLGVWILGGTEHMPVVDKPPYSDAVLPAATNLLENAHTVSEIAPGVELAVNMEELGKNVAHLVEVKKAKEDQVPITESLDRLDNNITSVIYGQLQGANQVASGAIDSHVTLSKRMTPFRRLFSQGAEDAKESRKNNERVHDKAVEETLGKVRKAIDESKKAQPPGAPPPAAADLDLDSIKGRRNR